MLRYMGVEPRKDQLGKEYRYGESPIVEVPDLIGMSIQDIYEQLNMNFTLSRSGVGRTVLSQAPRAGERVERGSVIRIYFSNEEK
jgi:stage V sporulation protein D (sporulation-specific penicillin-binding protein)